jgi:folate-dependent phosphoribosylglycinamide formyltransferase PurN
MRPWVAFFSQTGTEIHELSNALGIYPSAIVTNNIFPTRINSNLLSVTKFREIKLNEDIWHQMPSNRPTVFDYNYVLEKFENPVVTLHGFLKIVPKEICDRYEIYNLHPGLIDKYPALKGFNPQERAFTEGYKLAGCVIHKVTPGVDEGEILMSQGVNIEGLTLDGVYGALRITALDLWKSFFTAYKILEK